MGAFLCGDGSRRVMLLAGEAGIGKSSLLNACLTDLAASADGGAVAIGRGGCPPHFGPGYPYLPIMGALEDLCRSFAHAAPLLRAYAPAWLARLRHVAPDDTRPAPTAAEDGGQSHLDPEELIVFTQALGPVILAFEDLHWADHATLDFIGVLAEHPGLSQCRVFGTYRPAEAIATNHPIVRAWREMERGGRATELTLAGLDQAGVVAYLTARFCAASCPEWLALDLLARSSGNPLFLTVSVDHLVSAGGLGRSPDGQVSATERYPILSREIPESLRELVLQRFFEHSERDQSVLASASVVGVEAEAAAIAAALGEAVPAIDAACNALARTSLFLMRSGESMWPNRLVSGRYAFRHPLYQRVLYDELAPALRSEAHRRVAAALIGAFGSRAIEVAPVLADHFDRSHMASEATD
ncbi:MAG: ATP-binding protein, partial [Stellaceae bacterium]